MVGLGICFVLGVCVLLMVCLVGCYSCLACFVWAVWWFWWFSGRLLVIFGTLCLGSCAVVTCGVFNVLTVVGISVFADYSCGLVCL